MGIRATHRVTDSGSQTTGFIIDGNYTNYYDVVKNVSLIDNLTLAPEGVCAEEGELPIQSIKNVNKERYRRICRENPWVRDVQSELEPWRQNWNSKVLYVSGARQTGKTTEIFKFQKEELLMHISLYGKSADSEYEALTNLYRVYKKSEDSLPW